MASTIITKNSSTASATPAVGDLQQGELAVNVTDKKVYTKDSSAAIVKLVGSLGNQEASAVAITGGSIAGITDLAVADGGTGSSTAAGARSNLSAAASGANSDITSLSGLTTALSVAQGGTGVTSSTGSGSVVLSNSPTLVTPALGTPSAAVLTNATGLPLSTGISGLGTGVATFLGTPSSANLLAAVTDETGTGALVFANSPTLVTPALGTPASATLTNATGLPIGTGVSGLGTGVATALAVNVGSAGAPVVNGGVLGTPSSGTLTNATGLPISTGVSGLGTGVATALAVNVGSAGAPVVNGGALGTPSSGTVTNLTGTASININGTVGATTPTTGAFTTLSASSTVTLSGGTANGVTYLNGSKSLTTGSALTFDGTTLTTTGNAIISDNSSNAALQITQTGAGNALLVEDSANPDSTPFVVDTNGNIASGITNPSAYLGAGFGGLILKSTTAYAPQSWLWNSVNDISAGYNIFRKDRAGAIVQSGDGLGTIQFFGYDGANYLRGAEIVAAVDGTPGTNDMPGRLVFSTTADGASAPTERMRIANNGEIGIGSSNAAGQSVRMAKAITGSVNSYGLLNAGTVQSDVTSNAYYFRSSVSTAASAFTLTALSHYSTIQGTIGAGSAVTNQYGYYADSTLTGATNNYGFFGNIASGTGRYNLYMAGTADNYFAGNVGIGTSSPSYKLDVSASAGMVTRFTGGTPISIYSDATTAGLYNTAGTNGFMIAPASNALYWTTNSLERMRLDSAGNLGLGTSSPSVKLEVFGGTGIISKFLRDSGGQGININTDAAGNTLNFLTPVSAKGAYITADTNSTLLQLTTIGASPIILSTNNTVRATLDSSGNLGLGVTPSAWASPLRPLQIFNASLAGHSSDGTAMYLSANSYFDTSFKYISTGIASQYRQQSGIHSWYTAASGTAGNAISFTQAMTLDASGNLIVGGTTPVYGSSGRGVVTINGSAGALLGLTVGGADKGFVFHDGSNLLVSNTVSASLLFQTGNTERARIDSSGNLLVGTTSALISADYRLSVSGTRGGEFKSTGGATAATNTIWNNATTGDNVFESFRTETSDTQRGTISYNRTAGLVAYNTTSDYRAKDISGPVTNSGELIDSVPVYMGTMKGATQERPMFIAHETPAYAHTGEKDAVDADGNPVYQQMDASALIPVMWAEIQSLRQRVAQLETN